LDAHHSLLFPRYRNFTTEGGSELVFVLDGFVDRTNPICGIEYPAA
jgi:hypothetical protein